MPAVERSFRAEIGDDKGEAERDAQAVKMSGKACGKNSCQRIFRGRPPSIRAPDHDCGVARYAVIGLHDDGQETGQVDRQDAIVLPMPTKGSAKARSRSSQRIGCADQRRGDRG